MDDNLLSVKDYARHAGITEQAVYKKLRNEKSALHQYLVEQNHKKFIKREALKLLDNKPTPEKLESESLREMVDLLKSQLADKDDQIRHLQKINDQLSTSNAQLSRALKDTTASLHAAQALHAQTLQQLQEAKETDDPQDTSMINTTDPTQDVELTSDERLGDKADTSSDELPSESSTPEVETPKKKSFWARIFGF